MDEMNCNFLNNNQLEKKVELRQLLRCKLTFKSNGLRNTLVVDIFILKCGEQIYVPLENSRKIILYY